VQGLNLRIINYVDYLSLYYERPASMSYLSFMWF